MRRYFTLLLLLICPALSVAHYDSFFGDYNNIAYGHAGVSFNLDPVSGKASSINVDGLVLSRAN